MSLIGKTFSRLHYPVDVIAQCVRWYLAYSLCLHNLEDMMAERGILVDHSRLHRWVIRLVPLLDKAFRRRKRPVGYSKPTCHRNNMPTGETGIHKAR